MLPLSPEKEDVFSIEEFLTGTPVFSVLDKEEISSLAALAQIQRYERKKVIFARNDKAEWFYLISRGCVKLFNSTSFGEDVVIDVLEKGRFFGERALFNEGSHIHAAEAVDDMALVALPLSVIREHLEKNAGMALALLKAVADQCQNAEMEIEHRLLQNTSRHLGCFLLRLCGPDAKGKVAVRLPYDKNLLAARLGMKPETFSRTLARLRAEAGVQIKGSEGVIEDIDKLTGYSCSACSGDFPCRDMQETRK
ncbi:MAG: Crp/Fnr family transcriptional regulator [Pseudomonadota bacterium]